MSRLLNLTQCPVFKEAGDAKVTTDYGKDITDYPTEGKTGDHWGLDIVRSTGNNNSKTATIVAIESGTVYAQRKYVKDGEKSPSEGNCVYILHDDGVTITKYYHLKEGTVPEKIADNVRVEKGEVLGYMGNTGYSFGAHLHFQVEKLDKKPEKVYNGIIRIMLRTEKCRQARVIKRVQRDVPLWCEAHTRPDGSASASRC